VAPLFTFVLLGFELSAMVLFWAALDPAWQVIGVTWVPLLDSMNHFPMMTNGMYPGRAGMSSMLEYVFVRSRRGVW